MRQLIPSVPRPSQIVIVLVPLGLWAMLIVGIGPGARSGILDPGNPIAFFQGLRGVLPFVAATATTAFIFVKLFQKAPPRFGIIGPLGLATGYGLVGLVSTFNSPDKSEALWWAGLYLTVPVVLGGLAWSKDPLNQLRRLVNATWLIIILATIVLLAIAVIYLDFQAWIREPSRLFDCDQRNWFDLTSGRIRGTGVGRYSAIAGLIALGGLWHPKWRLISFILFSGFLIFLLYSGARGSFVGFLVGASLIIFLNLTLSGRRSIIIGLVVISLLLLISWRTIPVNAFLDNCILRTVSGLPTPLPPANLLAVNNSSTEAQKSDASIPPVSADLQATDLPPTNIPRVTEPAPSITGAHATPEALTTPTAVEKPPAILTPHTAKPIPPTQNPSKTSPDETKGSPFVPAHPTPSANAQAIPTMSANNPAIVTQPTAIVPTPTEPSLKKALPNTDTPASVKTIPQATDARQPSVPEPTVAVNSTTETGSSAKPIPDTKTVTNSFFKFSGRQEVWADGLDLFKNSPVLGYGFQADRLLLGTHMHNSLMHALLQTGLVGTIPFVLAMTFAWVLFIRIGLKLGAHLASEKYMMIQVGGVLAFLSMRSFPESTGAFFGVDWLILGLLLLYLQVVDSKREQSKHLGS